MAKLFILQTLLCLLSFQGLIAHQSYEWTQRIYLATYPRSGNHWMRYLLEDATNIITSSVYPDKNHTGIGAWGGFYKPMGYFDNCVFPEKDDPVIVKTHYPCFEQYPFDLLPCINTIRIVRHPVDSFYSFFLFRGGVNGARIPTNQLKYFINSWRRFQQYWDQQDNVLTIYYEDILENPKKYLELVLSESGFYSSNEKIEYALRHNPPKGFMLKHLEHFTKKDRELISREIGELMLDHGYEIPID